jgi:cobalt-zinc-cadmium efflux system outer membrane protein
MVCITGTRTAAIALLVLTLGRPVVAEELSLKQAIEQALRSNPTIAAGQLSATAAKYAAQGARALTNPEVSIAPSVVGVAGADSAILFVQPLEINGSRRVRGQIAAHEATASRFDANATQRDVVLAVKQTYWDIARAQELVKLNQDNVQYLDTLNKASKKQLEVGAVPGTQLIKTEVELARGRQELDQAQLELSLARASLNALLNRPKDIEFAATDPLVFSDVTLDPNALLAAACAQRPEVSSAQAQLAAAQGQIKAARLLTVPDLSIEARRGTLETESDGGVAIGLNLPILDWGSARGERQRAESAAQSQAKQLEAVRNQIALEVEQAVQQARTSAGIVREYQGGIIEKSEQLAAKAQEGYARGASGYLDVLEAQRTLRSTRTEYFSALSGYQKALAQLEWAAGSEQTR